MFRMIVGTLVALYCVLLVFGDESRRPAEVARAEAPRLNINFASWLEPVAVETEALPLASATTQGEAVEHALAAGQKLREERAADPLLGKLIAAVEAPEPEPETTVETEAALGVTRWYVTGTTVNVRAGPGTDNPVVAQVRLGDAAVVLRSSPSGWIEIKPEGTDQIGWISDRFLNQEAPG